MGEGEWPRMSVKRIKEAGLFYIVGTYTVAADLVFRRRTLRKPVTQRSARTPVIAFELA